MPHVGAFTVTAQASALKLTMLAGLLQDAPHAPAGRADLASPQTRSAVPTALAAMSAPLARTASTSQPAQPRPPSLATRVNTPANHTGMPAATTQSPPSAHVTNTAVRQMQRPHISAVTSPSQKPPLTTIAAPAAPLHQAAAVEASLAARPAAAAKRGTAGAADPASSAGASGVSLAALPDSGTAFFSARSSSDGSPECMSPAQLLSTLDRIVDTMDAESPNEVKAVHTAMHK